MGTNSMPCAFATPARPPGMPAPQLYHHGSADSSRRSCGLLDCPPNPRFGPARRATSCSLWWLSVGSAAACSQLSISRQSAAGAALTGGQTLPGLGSV